MTNDNEFFRFAASLSRAQASFDAKVPDEPEALPCIECGGSGTMGCLPECIQPDPLKVSELAYRQWQEAERFCIKHHTCRTCRGSGEQRRNS